MTDRRVHIFGIRHHGPGSARMVEQALDRLRPDCVLIEGPPDAEGVMALAAHEGMKPPVALLVYATDEPKRAAFYPFAEFSPEWRAMLHASREGVPARFMDLPQWHQLAEEKALEEKMREALAAASESEEERVTEEEAEDGGDEQEEGPAEHAEEEGDGDDALDLPDLRRDPLGWLAQAAGFNDSERWWDYFVETRRHDPDEVFAAVIEAMTALRDELPDESDEREQRREAYMRKTIRQAMKEGFERIAVICGAWHAPALEPTRMPSIKHDNALLKGLKKLKTSAAWCPWTYDRLASGSGYGAGVVSPAYYQLLWSGEPDIATRWMTGVGRLMRDADLDVSSAHVIEAVRLSETLSAMRGRPTPGLEEMDEAALTVVCEGMSARMRLIREKLVIGDRLGEVPEDSPAPPLQRDLAAWQKRLRLPAKAEIKSYDLDLRKPNDLERSHLLRRLRMLDIPWGEPEADGRHSKGTFREVWSLQWKPEFAVKLIEASVLGNTVAGAASSRAVRVAESSKRLAELTVKLDEALLAALPEAVEALVDAVQRAAATSADVPQLMQAIPPLAGVARYGNVRQTDTALIGGILQGIVARVCVGLSGTCASIDDDAAVVVRDAVQGMHGALATLQDEALMSPWTEALGRVADHGATHPLLAGKAVRILHDGGHIAAEETARRMGLALSRGADHAEAAAWAEGFLAGSGLVLVHDQALWDVIDGWVCGLSGEAFEESLPLIRRTFATFEPPERRQMGERVKRGGVGPAEAPPSGGFNHERAGRVLPLIRWLLGKETTP